MSTQLANTRIPSEPKIFHITHVNNLPAVLADGGLVSDRRMLAKGGPSRSIGMSQIKQRRQALVVHCHAGTFVGDFVPFYFCPRSIMLYVIHCANNPSLTYTGGQEPIIHLEADLGDVVAWAASAGRRWAFTASNAGARYADFFDDMNDLGRINWPAVGAKDFRHPDVKDGKQAEFLLFDSFPWSLVSRIGVFSDTYAAQVRRDMAAQSHQPPVEVMRNWYY